MDKRSLWEEMTGGGDPSPLADERFREIEAAGTNTQKLLGLASWADLYVHIGELSEKVNQELPFEIHLDSQVQDAGHFAVLGHRVNFGEYTAYVFGASFSLYGKLASLHGQPEGLGAEWLTPERLHHVERFAGLVAEAGYELVRRSDLNLPYTGSSFKSEWVEKSKPNWDYFFFNYW